MSDSPDWSIISVIKGIDATGALQGIRVDDQGRMQALLNALHNAAVTPLKSDASGNLLLNIKAQDLTFITSRPYYGDGEVRQGVVNCPDGAITEVFEYTGKRRLYGGKIWSLDANCYDTLLYFFIDGSQTFAFSADLLQKWNMVNPFCGLLSVSCCDKVTPYMALSILPLLQTETQLQLKCSNNVGNAVQIRYELVMAKVT